MKTTTKILVLLIIGVIISFPVMAQSDLTNPPQDDGVTLNAGLCLLIIGGLGYGLNRLTNKQRQNFLPKHLKNRK